MSSSHMRYSLDLVVDEDVKKPTKQTKTKTSSQNTFWFKNCKGLQTEVKKKSKKKKSPFVHIFFSISHCHLSIVTYEVSIPITITGAILEATGSFGAPLHYVGVSMYIAAALVLMAPLTKRWDEKAEARRQQSLNSEQA